MPEAVGAFKRAFAELHRRRVIRTAAAYLVAGWIARDSDLRALHGHPRFEALLAELR